jgi:drug/metabolite transporter (DMT)-like permease
VSSNSISPGSDGKAQTALLTSVAMLAFAANSLLCRLALGGELIDAASFATTRVVSGALTLALIMLPEWRRQGPARPDWHAAAMLATYMVFFSFAYLSLSAGHGALLLFGAVQLVYLVSPGLAAPDPKGALLMLVAGIAWGVYSLLGQRADRPLAATANNFLLSVPMVVLAGLLFGADSSISPGGLLLAVSSGAIASGLGYVVWYAALRGLKATQAATVQLSVPVIAAIGGIALLSEAVTLRLVLASAATLGGIALVLLQKNR